MCASVRVFMRYERQRKTAEEAINKIGKTEAANGYARSLQCTRKIAPFIQNGGRKNEQQQKRHRHRHHRQEKNNCSTAEMGEPGYKFHFTRNWPKFVALCSHASFFMATNKNTIHKRNKRVYIFISVYIRIFSTSKKVIMIDYTFYSTCLILPRSEKEKWKWRMCTCVFVFTSNAVKVGTHSYCLCLHATLLHRVSK